MGHALAPRVVTALLIYMLTSTSLWAAECEPAPYHYGLIGQQFSNLIPCSVDRLFGDWKDWVVGLFAGGLCGLSIVVWLQLQVPKIGISRNIAIRQNRTGSGEHQAIKIINKRQVSVFLKRDAIDIRAELHIVTQDKEGHEHVRHIELVRDDPLVLPPRQRRGRQPGMSEYVFRIKIEPLKGHEPVLKCELKAATALRFRLYARDSFSNYGKVFTQYYRKDEPPYGPVVRGCWPVGSLDFKPARDQATPLKHVRMVSFLEQLAIKDGIIHDLRQELDREKRQRRDFTDQQARPPIETAAAPGKQLLWAFAATILCAWFSRERSALDGRHHNRPKLPAYPNPNRSAASSDAGRSRIKRRVESDT